MSSPEKVTPCLSTQPCGLSNTLMFVQELQPCLGASQNFPDWDKTNPTKQGTSPNSAGPSMQNRKPGLLSHLAHQPRPQPTPSHHLCQLTLTRWKPVKTAASVGTPPAMRTPGHPMPKELSLLPLSLPKFKNGIIYVPFLRQG